MQQARILIVSWCALLRIIDRWVGVRTVKMTGQEGQRRSDVGMGQDQVAPVCFVTWHL